MNSQTVERKCSACDVDVLRTKTFLITGEGLYECPICGGLIAEGTFDKEELCIGEVCGHTPCHFTMFAEQVGSCPYRIPKEE